MTRSRPSMQKSTSKSGIDTRSGFRKRSNSRSCSIGSRSVMPQRPGHQRTGAGAAPRAHRHAVLARPADEVGDDEEVAGEAHRADHIEFARPGAPRSRRHRPAASRAGIARQRSRQGPLPRRCADVVFRRAAIRAPGTLAARWCPASAAGCSAARSPRCWQAPRACRRTAPPSAAGVRRNCSRV